MLFICIVTLIAFVNVPGDPRQDDGVSQPRCFLQNAVHRTVDFDEAWTVVARPARPGTGEWALVVAHQSFHDSVGPSRRSIIVFESWPGANALICSYALDGGGGGEALSVSDLGTARFIRRLRGDLDYQIHAFPTVSARDAIGLVRMILAERVREFEQPHILLTSGGLPAD